MPILEQAALFPRVGADSHFRSKLFKCGEPLVEDVQAKVESLLFPIFYWPDLFFPRYRLLNGKKIFIDRSSIAHNSIP